MTRHHHPNAYDRFIVRNTTPLIVQLSDILRLQGVTIPIEFPERIAIFENQFKVDASVLYDLLKLKVSRNMLSDGEVIVWHERLFPFVDSVLVWIEENWPSDPNGV